MKNYIFNIREDGTQEFIHKDHDSLIEKQIEWDNSEEALNSQISFTDEELEENEISYQNYLNEEYLKSTDWIAAKYTDEVLVLKNMTDEEFSLKYQEVLNKRKVARENIFRNA